jgi:dynein heavy chain
MVPLMERIAGEVAEKVALEVDIKTILRAPPEAAQSTARQAGQVLGLWHSSYITVRSKIEQSGTDHRWEFDRKRLFEQTDYMAKVCTGKCRVDPESSNSMLLLFD